MTKVAVVIPKYGLVGGAEGFAHVLTERLAMRGEFEIHVFANRYRRGKAPIVFHRVPMLVFPRFLRQISFAFFVNRQLKSGEYDLVHSHDRIFRMDLFTFHGIPHEIWIRRMRNKPLSLFDRAMIRVEKEGLTGPFGPTVLPVSSLVKEELQKIYTIPENRIEVIHPGVSLNRFSKKKGSLWRAEIRKRHGIHEKDLVILFVGMNFEIKRLGLLIEGISRFSQLNPNGSRVKLLVVGKGKAAVYEAMAREQGVSDRLIFAGVTREVEKYYVASDIFAMPSVYDTFGMAVLEAMAAGLPVIISQTVGARDLVNDGVEGFILADPPTSVELARKIDFLSNPENRTAMGENAREQALQHGWDHVADRVLTHYLRIFSGRT
ncbi:MAG: glycosyltransferase family 4 protein [Deltaproteobacteria bacterium]|nr:glycosyltransferase family 4 protein [Deltaproteobacteria bacterium]